MTLLNQINEDVNAQIIFKNKVDANVALLAEDINKSESFIAEAITNWLAKVNGVVTGGKLDPQKGQSVAEILGATIALSDSDTASAFDDKGDLGTVLYMASSKNPQESNAALKRLREIGRHPSVRSYTKQAKEAMADPAAFKTLINNTKSNIDKVMRTKLSKEKQKTNESIFRSTAV